VKYLGRKYILLRFDDICPTMNYYEFNRALEIMDSIGVKALLGVIPDCKDPDLLIEKPHDDFWKYVKELQKSGYTIAMHGYQHIFDSETRGLINSGYKSELAGHTFEEQKEKIRKGKQVLLEHGIETDIFFAPAHSYDMNTIKALEANGFKYMSDGMSAKPYQIGSLICIPSRVSGAHKLRKNGYHTVIFHAHEWVRPDKVADFERLKLICDKYRTQIVTFDEYKSRANGILAVQILDEKIFVFWKRYLYPIIAKVWIFMKRNRG
jgi:predicted deacetylase